MNALSGLSKKMRDSALHLVREVAAERSFSRGRIVRRADLRKIQQPGVVQRERSQNHGVGGLEELLAVRVGVLDSGGAAVLVNDAPHPASGAQLKALVLAQHRHQRIGGLRLRADHAAEALAIAAIGAGGARDAVRIRVGFAQVGRGRRIRMIAQLARGLLEQMRRIGMLQRRRGIFVRRGPSKILPPSIFLPRRLPALPLTPIICSAYQ